MKGRRGSGLRRAAVVLWVLLACAACGPPEGVTPSTDWDPASPRAVRVVSLSPLASRFLLLLEAQDRLVGVDRESARLPGLEELEELPVVDADSLGSLAPDLILVPPGPLPAPEAGGGLAQSGADVLVFAPASLEDVYMLFRGLGSRLVGRAQALRAEIELARPLALIGGESYGQRQLRALAVTGFAPLEFAGAHSFETDLIEIAGAESVTHTHGVDAERIAASSDRLAAYAPEWVLVITPVPPSRAEREGVLREVGASVLVDFVTLDARTFWLDAPTETAQRFRALTRERTRELEAEGR